MYTPIIETVPLPLHGNKDTDRHKQKATERLFERLLSMHANFHRAKRARGETENRIIVEYCKLVVPIKQLEARQNSKCFKTKKEC